MNSTLTLCLSAWIALGVGRAPSPPAEAGTLPEAHGIAVFGGVTHHMDLFLALLREGEADAETKGLRAELHMKAEMVPKLLQAMEKVVAAPEKLKDGDEALKAMDH